MASFERQFRAIVGCNYTPSQELDAEQARALTALIFSMPNCEVVRDGEFIEYEGWSPEEGVYLAVTVNDQHTYGADAICGPLDRFDE